MSLIFWPQILYLGTIVDDLCCGRTSLIFDRYFWETRFFHLVGVRNLLVAPLAEELIFRACIIFHLQRLYPSCHELCIISPLFFSIAHFHHIYERVYDGESLWKAFLSARNILSAVVAHSLCNFMGLPDPMGAIERAKYRWGLLGQLLAIGAHVGGIVLWGFNLYSMTEPELFGNRICSRDSGFSSIHCSLSEWFALASCFLSEQLLKMTCVERLKGNVSFESVGLIVDNCLIGHERVGPTELHELTSLTAFLDGTYFVLRQLLSRFKAMKRKNETKSEPYYENALSVIDLLLCPTRTPSDILGEPVKPKSEMARNTRISYLRHLLTQVWISFLDNQLPDELMLKALRLLGDDHIGRLSDARQLADYVIPVFDLPATGDAVQSDNDLFVPPSWSRAVSRAVLALVHKGGLNYPRLYPRLYELLDDSLLHCPEAERFLLDLDLYLSSLHLAVGVVAAFIKRLSQLALIAPMRLTPAFLLLIHNALKRHPKCGILVNRTRRHPQPETGKDVVEQSWLFWPHSDQITLQLVATIPGKNAPCVGDPYRWNANNLESSGAMESSLWEVASLTHHHSSLISSLARDICHPNPESVIVDSTSPSTLIRQQILDLTEISEDVHRNLSILSKSNAQMPMLQALDGWTYFSLYYGRITLCYGPKKESSIETQFRPNDIVTLFSRPSKVFEHPSSVLIMLGFKEFSNCHSTRSPDKLVHLGDALVKAFKLVEHEDD
ncbi:CBF/Mak21 family protein [Opisthorchis viverrini]|uniref:CBF/Mak21 family protein n=1 Tax=Opisthorchis viverrini TaxID=6198 RepID=A0A1S8WWX0_OPIVI|nr:CBF/Mak21 family protein [Opisthorchis viverrini]